MHDALEWVYARNASSRVFLCPYPNSSTCRENQIDLFSSASPFADNSELAARARVRVQEWKMEYAMGVLDSGLLRWLGQLPVVAVIGDALVTHVGLSLQVLDYVKQYAKQEGIAIGEALDGLTNVPFYTCWSLHLIADAEGKLAMITKTNTINNIPEIALSLIGELVTYRGNFNDKNEASVDRILSILNLHRIVVGHTPHDFATEFFDGRLLATDSTLSRTFRAFGNLYCPVRDGLRKTSIEEISDRAREINDVCEGSILQLRRKSSSDPWPKNVVEVTDALDNTVRDEF